LVLDTQSGSRTGLETFVADRIPAYLALPVVTGVETVVGLLDRDELGLEAFEDREIFLALELLASDIGGVLVDGAELGDVLASGPAPWSVSSARPSRSFSSLCLSSSKRFLIVLVSM
jgi:hypothetical protein